MKSGWIGVDLDGTLAKYDGWRGPGHIGPPVPAMVERVKQWIAEGKDVRIFTARAYDPGDSLERAEDTAAAIVAINQWCRTHLGKPLPITCVKDYGMIELWDDRAVQIVANTGQRADGNV